MPAAIAFASTGIFDHYDLLHYNKTYNGIPKGMEMNGVPTILAHTFQSKSLANSQCVKIITCAPPESKPHMDLVNAVKKEKSLSWQVFPCKDPDMYKKLDQKKGKGNSFVIYLFKHTPSVYVKLHLL